MQGGKRTTYRRSRAGHEDQRSEVGSTLVAEGSGGVDQSTNTVGLDGRADEGGSPSSSSGGSLLGLDELLLGVSSLGAVVGVTENGTEDSQGSGVVEDRAERDGRGLNGR